jgi:hypothetical protein
LRKGAIRRQKASSSDDEERGFLFDSPNAIYTRDVQSQICQRRGKEDVVVKISDAPLDVLSVPVQGDVMDRLQPNEQNGELTRSQLGAASGYVRVRSWTKAPEVPVREV